MRMLQTEPCVYNSLLVLTCIILLQESDAQSLIQDLFDRNPVSAFKEHLQAVLPSLSNPERLLADTFTLQSSSSEKQVPVSYNNSLQLA